MQMLRKNGMRNVPVALLAALTALAVGCAGRSQPATTLTPPAAAPVRPAEINAAPSPVVVATAPSFAETVRPVLARRCAPCHEKGGLMYERLPFDDANVVRSHAPSILKRLKAPEEKAAVQRWVDGAGGE